MICNGAFYNCILMILSTLSRDGKQSNKQSDHPNSYNLPLTDKGFCEYNNAVTLQKISPDSIKPNEIKVSNKLCQQNGEFMEKVTIIKFNNEVITIRDRYRFFSTTQQTLENNLQKRIHIFKKPLHSENKFEGKRRVTKNLPKNFIKAFLNYLESVKDEKNAELLDCKMKLFTSRQKYNNSFIQRIVDDPDLENYFADFLNNHAKDWIENSKIRDKEVHLQAIEVFKRLSSCKGERKEQHFGGFDSYLSSFQDQSQRISSFQKQQNSDKQSIRANSSKSDQDQIRQ